MTNNTSEVRGVYLAVRMRSARNGFFPTAYLTHQSRLPHAESNGGGATTDSCLTHQNHLPHNGNNGNGGYALSFTAAAKENKYGFMLENDLGFIRHGFDSLHESDDVPDPFSKRLMPKSRPDYAEYLDWLGLSKEEVAENPLRSLARSHGRKHGDSFETFAVPESHNGEYDFIFPLRGIRYLTFDSENDNGAPKRRELIDIIRKLESGDVLSAQKEPGNPADCQAVALYSAAGTKVGYCPRVFAPEINQLMDSDKVNMSVKIDRVNPTAPLTLMAFCRLTCQKPDDFAGFCKTDDYKLLAPEMAELNV